MAFSFPYPELGTTVRPIDQGCRVCVHQMYCPAMYWFRRGGDSRGFAEEPITDKHMGIQCASWSNNPVDKVTTPPTADDLAEIEYMWQQGIGSEPNRAGISDATGAANKS